MKRPDHCEEVYDRPFYESEVDNSVYNDDAVETMSKRDPSINQDVVMPDIYGW